MARECPVKPQELRESFSAEEQALCHLHGAYYSGYVSCPTCEAMIDRAEQSREQPAVPSSTATQMVTELQQQLATERASHAEELRRVEQERYTALFACKIVKEYLNGLERLPEDDPLLQLRRRYHKPLHTALDAALRPSEQAKGGC